MVDALYQSMYRALWLLACAACVADLPPTSTNEEELAAATPPPEIVRIRRGHINGFEETLAFKLRDNLAIGPYLAPDDFATAAVTVFNAIDASGHFKRLASDHRVPVARSYVNTVMQYPGLAVYNLDETPSSRLLVDRRTTTELTGETLECWALGAQPRSTRIQVTGGTTDELVAGVVTSSPYFEPTDVGVPCITTNKSPPMVAGVVKRVVGARTATLYRAGSLAYWFDGLANLARLRFDAHLTGPFQINTLPSGSNPPRMCIDIPFGDPHEGVHVQQYPCHSDTYPDDGTNQMFYIDNSSPDTHPRLVSATSGRCLDVEVGDLVAGRKLQEHDCHAGANQRFDSSALPPELLPDSGLAASPAMCISVHDGPSRSPAGLEQRPCKGAIDQVWTFTQVALPRI